MTSGPTSDQASSPIFFLLSLPFMSLLVSVESFISFDFNGQI
ncbi:hypothetical protein RV14_GL001122 [Enterococcus ratti]|uniref:Uncharacterized protein n=1 Tax=Enterococcus ratti TaxID=150033 RepID=A0A1L8WCA7_9ENTE|nr:hypothetical protein RV14_GL001122 [Enterococcus ratti]